MEKLPESTKSTGSAIPMPANQSTPEVTRAPIRIALEDVTPTIAAAFGDDLCLIWSGEWQSYWCAGGNGYTKDVAQAGWYTIQAAYVRTRHCDPSKQIAFERPDATPARGGDELREAAQAMLPKELCLTNENWPDGTIVPIDVTLGELRRLSAALLASTDMAGAGEMTQDERRLEDLKQMAAYSGPIVSFDVREPYYLASCDHCGWVGSSEHCGTDSFGDDSDVYCPRCQTGGADCGKVAERIASAPPAEGLRALSDRATPGPWAWEQCGEKEDVPVVGIAFPGDDPDCKAPYEGEFCDSDASRMTIAYDWQWCDGNSPSANAAFAVACVNYVRAMLSASPKATATASVRELTDAALKDAVTELLSARGERPYRVLRGGQELWEMWLPAFRAAMRYPATISQQDGGK